MTDSNYCYGLLKVIDLLAYPPIANTDAPQVLTSFHFEAAVRTRIICEMEGSGDYSVLRWLIEPLQLTLSP